MKNCPNGERRENSLHGENSLDVKIAWIEQDGVYMEK